eukprot:2566048-Amphidinium_carterae.1
MPLPTCVASLIHGCCATGLSGPCQPASQPAPALEGQTCHAIMCKWPCNHMPCWRALHQHVERKET